MTASMVSSEDIWPFESHEILDHAENIGKKKRLLARIADVFQVITSDDVPHVLISVEKAYCGRGILNVHVLKSEQGEHVKGSFVAHVARNSNYFGRWSITVLHHEQRCVC